MIEDPKKFIIDSFKVVRDFVIEIHYMDGKIQTIDFRTINRKGWWEKLKNHDFFVQLKINPIHNLEWPNEYDFNPKHLYYWEEYGKYYAQPDFKGKDR